MDKDDLMWFKNKIKSSCIGKPVSEKFSFPNPYTLNNIGSLEGTLSTITMQPRENPSPGLHGDCTEGNLYCLECSGRKVKTVFRDVK